MKYSADKIASDNKIFTDWAKNLAKDLEGKEEDKDKKDIFPNSEDGDVATIKDLVGNFVALLTGKDFEIQ